MKLLKTALFCAFAALTIPAQAATVSLDLTSNAPAFSDGDINNGDTVSAGPFSLTFKNFDANGDRVGRVDNLGVLLGTGFTQIAKVDLVFNIDTVIETYTTRIFGFGNFQISGPNGTSGLNSFRVVRPSTFDMGTIPVFLAGQTYTLTHTESFVILSEFGLSSPPAVTPVPLPASLPLLLAGFGAFGLLRRRA